jgi:hypothetical protein
MRVRICNYRSWVGPYQVADALCFWVKEVPDEYGCKSKPHWVHQFGEWLAYGSVRPELEIGETQAFADDKRKPTWLHRFLSWIHSKKQRKIYVRIDRWDTWSMDDTLAYIILPMLKQLREQTHGSPHVDDEDVPEYLRSTAAPELSQGEKDTGHVDDNHHARWEWVLGEMIHAFETKAGDLQDWEEQFTTGEYDLQFKKIDASGTSEMVYGPKHTAKTDYEAQKEYADRIQNGFRLFGKYYQSLWS